MQGKELNELRPHHSTNHVANVKDAVWLDISLTYSIEGEVIPSKPAVVRPLQLQSLLEAKY